MGTHACGMSPGARFTRLYTDTIICHGIMEYMSINECCAIAASVLFSFSASSCTSRCLTSFDRMPSAAHAPFGILHGVRADMSMKLLLPYLHTGHRKQLVANM